VLVAYYLHMPRARLIFRQEGFRFERAVAVGQGESRTGPIVPRLWYYRYRPLHLVYEILAYPAYLVRFR
jgi:hypothetical protein